jgi:hypothetical protein
MSRRPAPGVGVEGVVAALADLGFRKRAGHWFTIELCDGVLGCVGLNKASRSRSRGETLLNPVVGVRHQSVERVVADLCLETFHENWPATVSRPLRYLVPESARRDWVVDGSPADAAVIDDLANAVQTWGASFMRSSETLAGLVAALRSGSGSAAQTALRLPVALWLTGDAEGAMQTVACEVASLGPRSDDVAVQLRGFARNLIARITAEG